ncbi:hypothetical protein JNN96_36175 [Mycobacterium sp. DSM 3803]|nr:hypothetical protein [Mycobacterium sp. DSM 3803]
MNIMGRFTTSESAPALEQLVDAGDWACAHPLITAGIAVLLATTVVTAVIRALRRFLKLALIALLLGSAPLTSNAFEHAFELGIPPVPGRGIFDHPPPHQPGPATTPLPRSTPSTQ